MSQAQEPDHKAGPLESAPTPDADRPAVDNQTARNAGRGGLAVFAAKVFFVLSGLVQQTLLRPLIGLAGYGAFSLVLAAVNVPNNVVVASSTQSVSRAVARSRGYERETFRSAMRVHVPLALGAALLFAAAAPFVSGFEGNDITLPLVIVAIVLFMYGVYAPTIGLLNGRGQFTLQAALDMTFAVIRTVGLLGVGYLFARGAGHSVLAGLASSDAGVAGAAVGFALAATLIVPVALAMARRPAPASGPAAGVEPPARVPFRTKAYLADLLPLAGAQLFTSAVMQVDISLLGRFLSHGASGTGLAGAAAKTAANEWVAVYRACQLFAFLPYQLLLSITQILFPMVARVHAQNDQEAVRRYVERGARLAAIACGMMVAVVAGLPETLLAFAFGTDVAVRGASTLRVLALGQGAFTMLGIATSVLVSIGRERMAAAITGVATVAVAVACFFLASDAPFGASQLQMTAFATSGALVLTLLVAASAVRRLTGGFVPLATAARVSLAVAVLVAAGTFLPRFGRLAAPLVAAVLAALYLAMLVASRELTRADSKALRSLRS